MRGCALLLAVGLAWAPRAVDAADPPVCGHCGCCQHVRKVCRVVCEIVEEKSIVYNCEHEDFCVPGPSLKCGCKEICTCGEVRTRRKLVKREEVKKVPKYKCVVEYLCPHCGDGCQGHPEAKHASRGFPWTIFSAGGAPRSDRSADEVGFLR